METIGDRIAKTRLAHNMTQDELAQMIGTNRQNICRYELGVVKDIPHERIDAIAKALRVTPAYLMGYDVTVTDDVIQLPIIGDVAAGFDHLMTQSWEGETVEIPRSYLRGRPVSDYFALRVDGTSMEPDYQDGDIVIVLRQATLNRSGDIGVIRYEGDKATLKKVEFVYGEDWMMLIPLNTNGHSPQLIKDAALEECSVLGIPRMVIREVKE